MKFEHIQNDWNVKQIAHQPHYCASITFVVVVGKFANSLSCYVCFYQQTLNSNHIFHFLFVLFVDFSFCSITFDGFSIILKFPIQIYSINFFSSHLFIFDKEFILKIILFDRMPKNWKEWDRKKKDKEHTHTCTFWIRMQFDSI